MAGRVVTACNRPQISQLGGTVEADVDGDQPADGLSVVRGARGAVVFAGVVVITCIGAVAMALDFTGRASTAPLTIGLPAIGMSLVVLVRDARRWWHVRRGVVPGMAGGSRWERLRGNPYLWLAVFLVAFYLLGALWSLVVFSVTLMRIRGGLAWIPVLLITVGSSIVFYLVVEVLLREELYSGVLL